MQSSKLDATNMQIAEAVSACYTSAHHVIVLQASES